MQQSFARQIFGHERARATLGRFAESAKVPPSLIFSGPPGIGKRRLADSFARALNCTEASAAARPCDRCASCNKATRGNHPDVQAIEPAANRAAISIQQIREMIAELGMKPYEGRRRVTIIEQADGLSVDAMNSLLKSLEEPPGDAVIILLAVRPSLLISTIHSRCQHLRLTPLSLDEVEGCLRAEGLSPGEAHERARFASGSPGAALDDELVERARDAGALLEDVAIGRAHEDPISVARELHDRVKAKKEGAELRRGVQSLGLWLLRALRDLLLRTTTGRPPRELMAPFADEVSERLAPTARPRDVQRALDSVEQLQRGMERNLHVQLSLEALVIELSSALYPGASRR
jgi:DNA polymerase III subunit delta'